MCTAPTVMRVEKGTPTVSMGIYLRVLFALGLDESILYLAKDDEMGRTLSYIYRSVVAFSTLLADA